MTQPGRPQFPPKPATAQDIRNLLHMLTRIETRLCLLAVHIGAEHICKAKPHDDR